MTSFVEFRLKLRSRRRNHNGFSPKSLIAAYALFRTAAPPGSGKGFLQAAASRQWKAAATRLTLAGGPSAVISRGLEVFNQSDNLRDGNYAEAFTSIGTSAGKGFGLGVVNRTVGDLAYRTTGPTQYRSSGAIQTQTKPNQLVVRENHLETIFKVFQRHEGKLNLLSPSFWKHVFPHKHTYTSPTAPNTLNANWRKTFSKPETGSSKTTTSE